MTNISNDVRLKPKTIPRHYDLHYTSIDLINHVFSGTVCIHLEEEDDETVNFTNNHSDDERKYNDDDHDRESCSEEDSGSTSSSIILHSLELNFISATLTESASSVIDKGTTEGKDDRGNKKKHNQISSSCTELSPSQPVSPSAPPSPSVLHAVEFVYSKKSQTCEIIFETEEGSNRKTRNKPTRSTSTAATTTTTTAIYKKRKYYELVIKFTGVLNNKMNGLYRSTYKSIDGKTTCTMACTQFEPTSARRAFPCFDEPSLKSTFTLNVTIPVISPFTGLPLSCISNTPVVRHHTTLDKETMRFMKTIQFDKTPYMSTYLVALIVGELDKIAITSPKTGIQTSVYTVMGKAQQGTFCVNVACRCLDLYSDMFGIPYPLKKSDLIAIPDFNSGAMENWGCVTYREAKILVEDGSTSETTRRGIARTVCHELAHQWFGNLVTMDYWTQLWLKEGVARYMEFVGIDLLFPRWDAWTEFVQSVYGLALSLDSMISSHPVEVEVNHPDEINEIYDAISYAKGASLIRMVASYVGFDVFMEGMKYYLNRYSYSNATTEMLWEALEHVSNKPIVKIMSPWTLQVGYPILILPTYKEDESSGEKIILRPRFLASGPTAAGTVAARVAAPSVANEVDEQTKGTGGGGGGKWPIPVTAIVEGDDKVHGPWMIDGPNNVDESSSLLEQINIWCQDGKWFKLNASQTGFYRVAYTPKQWKRLSKILSPQSSHSQQGSSLSASDRLGLISDSFAIAKAGYASIIDALKLAIEFGSHDHAEYAVWQELSEHLTNLSILYRSESFYPKYQSLVKYIYKRQMYRLSFDSNSTFLKQQQEEEKTNPRIATLRGTVIRMMGIHGNDETVKAEALKRFIDYAGEYYYRTERKNGGKNGNVYKKDDGQQQVLSPSSSSSSSSSLPGDLRLVIFKIALLQNESDVYETLKRIYDTATTSLFPEDLRNCLIAMGSVRNKERHEDMLNYVLFSGKVRMQDIAFPLNALSSTTDFGGKACWNFFKSNYSQLYSIYGKEGSFLWGPLIALSCRGLRTLQEVKNVEQFFFGSSSNPEKKQHVVVFLGSAKRRLSQSLEAIRTRANRLERDRDEVDNFLNEECHFLT